MCRSPSYRRGCWCWARSFPSNGWHRVSAPCCCPPAWPRSSRQATGSTGTSSSCTKKPRANPGLFRLELPVVGVAVVVQRNRSTGGLAEVRAVVLVLVGRDRVRRGPSLLGRLNLAVAVAVDAGTGRDQLSDDHVLLQTVELVAAAVDRRIGQHSRGLLERRRAQPRVGGQ